MKDYVVGIDFGHGETSAWVVPINPNINTQIGETGNDLKLNPANDFNPQWSLIYYRIDESGCNRDASLKNGPQKVTAFCFKGKPCTLFGDNGLTEQGWAYQEYIRLIFERMMERNGDTLMKYEDGNYNFDLCIACPTKWSADERRGYIEFFNDVLRPKGISVSFIMNESDAAFFSQFSRDNMGMNVLVIDYGSSTIDYTLIGRGRKLSDDSWSNSQLGASQMEREIVNYLMEAPDFDEKIERTLLACQSTGNSHYTKAKILDFFTLEARRAKELSFKDTMYPSLRTVLFSMAEQCGDYYAEDPPFDNTSFHIRGNLEVISQKYREAIKQEFTILKNRVGEVLQGDQPDKIILSGGACVMDWIYKTVEDIFGTEVEIERDTHASFVVSKGVALYGQNLHKALKMLEARIDREDFATLFMIAETTATANAIENLLPSITSEIIATTEYNTVRKIIGKFVDFLVNLGSTGTYRELLQLNLDKIYSQRIGEIVGNVLLELFAINIDTTSVNVHVDARPFYFNNTNGGLSQKILECIEASPFGKVWRPDAERTPSEQKQIAEGILKPLLNWIRNDYGIFNQADIELTAGCIRSAAKNAAKEVFIKYQLFRETIVRTFVE